MKNLKLLFIPLIILIILGTASASQVTDVSQTMGHGSKLVQSSQPTSNDLSVYYVDVKGNDNNTGKNIKQAFKTIQKAINVGKGNFCVVVAKGVYYENLVMNKNVKLIGNSSKNTVVNGNNKSSCVWIKNSGDVQIEGLTFTNGKSFSGEEFEIKAH
ncbi:MAG: pectinesterase family protein [Methanobacterium sp. ERen5]|nr:MAG: pectinesterase family protein [Methanobacterium sp. ERen5]